ncbi:MAG TPA: phosphate acyltransferase [Candidatus Paceibacterota bacterium]
MEGTLTDEDIIAVDAMGSKKGPSMILQALERAAEEGSFHFLVFGESSIQIPQSLRRHTELVPTTQVVSDGMKPLEAARLRDSSMRRAILAVKEKRAAAAISGGNTAALQALATHILREGKSVRPALASCWPTRLGQCVMLDLGGNINCSAADLEHFARRGKAFARAFLGVERPRIGILNTSYSLDDAVRPRERDAHELLTRAEDLHYCGFVNGADMLSGAVDVIVTDGFTGNFALKGMEGAAKAFGSDLRDIFTGSLLGRIAYVFSRGAIQEKIKKRMDPDRFDGAALLGLPNPVVKSHNGAGAEGFKNAIFVASRLLRFPELFA